MRLLSFEFEGRETFGLLKNDGGIIEIPVRSTAAGSTAGLREWLAAGGGVAELRALDSAAANLKLADVTLLPVIPDPRHIWCLAINYEDHIAEIKTAGIQRDRPAHPAVFMRYADSLVAHGRPMLLPRVSDAFDWEGELAVIIGRGGRHIEASRAMQHVAGYSIFNDGSIRDWQFHTRQIAPGKNFYHTGALGPWMVTADAVADPHALGITTRLNGTVMQHGSTADMIFKIPEFIAYVSAILPLEPGDVLATGTPSGVGFSRKPPLYMKAGDTCSVEIEGLGTLTNPIVAAGD
jgi:2-keto-4-pentenoate hydratase/2-oxohepta-3-ene-1,7-dioic acid hydratase in catechol pathway